MLSRFLIIFLTGLFLFCPTVHGFELQTRYTIIKYENEMLLNTFSKQLISNSSWNKFFKIPGNISVKEKIKISIDQIVDKNKHILNKHSDGLIFKVVLLPSVDDVAKKYESLYKHKKRPVAFYSPKTNNLYISVNNTRLRGLAQLIAHAMIITDE